MTTYGYRVARSRVEMICDEAAQVIMIYLLSVVITISEQSVMHERFSCIWHVLRQYDDIKREHCSSLSDVVNNQSDQCFIPCITNTPNITSRDLLISNVSQISMQTWTTTSFVTTFILSPHSRHIIYDNQRQ